MTLKHALLGKPLKNEALHTEKLSRLWGLPIMASDAVSSVAYAIEEILIVLVPVLGFAAFGFVPGVVVAILLLLTIWSRCWEHDKGRCLICNMVITRSSR